MRLSRHALWLLLLVATPAFAQDAPDFNALAKFIRWGGVLASIPLMLGVFFVIRLLDNLSDRLSARFSNRRPTIQKVQTTARFFIYIAAFALTTSLSVRLDPTVAKEKGLGKGKTLTSAFGYAVLLQTRHAGAFLNPSKDDTALTLDLECDPGLSVKGSVADPDGKPADGVSILGRTNSPFEEPETLQSADFTVTSLAPDRPRPAHLPGEWRRRPGHGARRRPGPGLPPG